MKGAGKRDPRPADSPGRLRQSEAGKANAHHLKPFLPGQTGNREGKNGAKWLAEFKTFFDSPALPTSKNTRFYNVCEALYVKAIKGSEIAQKTIIEHMKGKAVETLQLVDEKAPRVLVLLPSKGGVLEVPNDQVGYEPASLTDEETADAESPTDEGEPDDRGA